MRETAVPYVPAGSQTMGSTRTQRGKFPFMKMPTSVHSLVDAHFKPTQFHLTV